MNKSEMAMSRPEFDGVLQRRELERQLEETQRESDQLLLEDKALEKKVDHWIKIEGPLAAKKRSQVQQKLAIFHDEEKAAAAKKEALAKAEAERVRQAKGNSRVDEGAKDVLRQILAEGDEFDQHEARRRKAALQDKRVKEVEMRDEEAEVAKLVAKMTAERRAAEAKIKEKKAAERAKEKKAAREAKEKEAKALALAKEKEEKEAQEARDKQMAKEAQQKKAAQEARDKQMAQEAKDKQMAKDRMAAQEAKEKQMAKEAQDRKAAQEARDKQMAQEAKDKQMAKDRKAAQEAKDRQMAKEAQERKAAQDKEDKAALQVKLDKRAEQEVKVDKTKKAVTNVKDMKQVAVVPVREDKARTVRDEDDPDGTQGKECKTCVEETPCTCKESMRMRRLEAIWLKESMDAAIREDAALMEQKIAAVVINSIQALQLMTSGVCSETNKRVDAQTQVYGAGGRKNAAGDGDGGKRI